MPANRFGHCGLEQNSPIGLSRAFSSATLVKRPRSRLHLSPRQPWTVIAPPFPAHGTPKGSPKYRRLAAAVPPFIVCECRSPFSLSFCSPPSPATQQKNGTTSKTFDPMYCCWLSPQLRSDMYTATRRFALFPSHNSWHQLLRSPSLAALSSFILATRFLNSTYWHFS